MILQDDMQALSLELLRCPVSSFERPDTLSPGAVSLPTLTAESLLKVTVKFKFYSNPTGRERSTFPRAR